MQVQLICWHIQLSGFHLTKYDLYYEGHLSALWRVFARGRKHTHFCLLEYLFCFWLQVITLKCVYFCLLWLFLFTNYNGFPEGFPWRINLCNIPWHLHDWRMIITTSTVYWCNWYDIYFCLDSFLPVLC